MSSRATIMIWALLAAALQWASGGGAGVALLCVGADGVAWLESACGVCCTPATGAAEDDCCGEADDGDATAHAVDARRCCVDLPWWPVFEAPRGRDDPLLGATTMTPEPFMVEALRPRSERRVWTGAYEWPPAGPPDPVRRMLRATVLLM